MIKINELLRLKIFLLISFLFIVFTNTYFSYEQSIIYGAKDGADYFLIAKNFLNVSWGFSENINSINEEIEYQRAWRFIIPSLIGFLGKISGLDVYLIFRVFILIFCIAIILIFLEILKSLKFNTFHTYFLSSFIIFNPYLFRYFIALPTMINDLIFICASLLLVLGFVKNKKFFFLFRYFTFCIYKTKLYFFFIKYYSCKISIQKRVSI